VSPTYLVVPIRFSATVFDDDFSKRVSDIALQALNIQIFEPKIAPTIRMLDINNRNAEYVSNRLGLESVFQGEDALIFDVGGLQPSPAPSPIWTKGLLEYVGKLRANGNRAHIICIFPCSFQPAAIEFRDVKHCIETHNISIFYNDGTVVQKGDVDGSLKYDSVPEVASIYQEDVEFQQRRLLTSLVRHPGAFRFDDQSAVYPFRYSISKNRTEIIELVANLIVHASERESVRYVTYWSGELWFGQMVENLSLDQRLKHLRFIKTSRLDMNSDICEPYLHLVPFFGSGYDLSRALNAVAERPRAIIAIGCTLNEAEQQHGPASKVLKMPSGASVLVEYLFAVPGTSDHLVKLWQEVDVSENQFPHKDAAKWENGWNISPPAFWAMALETGFGKEEYGSDRNMLENVPSMRELVSKNGAFLAEKIILFTQEKFGAPPDRSVIFVRIDEAGTEPLNEILGNAMDRVVISVPRKLLDRISTERNKTINDLLADTDISDIVHAFVASFSHALQEVGCAKPEHAKVVILDEFVVTGTSMDQLSRLLEMVNLENYCKLALFNFGVTPSESSSNSLYQLTLD
jgi:hypothetical protein